MAESNSALRPQPKGTDKRRKHGLAGHPLYKTWGAMVSRCHNPADASFPGYGGRGIQVCARWHDPLGFIEDIERTLGPRPAGCTLDRIDNDGNYEPGNVQWATAKVQASHRRRAVTRSAYRPHERRFAKVCSHCGGEYRAARQDSWFCSKTCKAAARRAAGKDDITKTCHQCGGAFSRNRYDKTSHCSQSCAASCQHAGGCPSG